MVKTKSVWPKLEAWKRWALVGALFLALFATAQGSSLRGQIVDGDDDDGDAETRVSVEVRFREVTEAFAKVRMSEANLARAVDLFISDMKRALDLEVAQQKAYLVSPLSGFGDANRNDIASMLKRSSNDVRVQNILKDIERMVSNQIYHELNDEAESFVEDCIIYIELQDKADLFEQGLLKFIENITFGIDRAANEIVASLPERVARAKKQVLEKYLLHELGHPVALQIVDGEVAGVQQALAEAQQQQEVEVLKESLKNEVEDEGEDNVEDEGEDDYASPEGDYESPTGKFVQDVLKEKMVVLGGSTIEAETK